MDSSRENMSTDYIPIIFTSDGQRVLGSGLTQPLTQLAEQTSLLWSVVSQACQGHRLVCDDVVLGPHRAGQGPLPPPPDCPADWRPGAPVLRCDLNIEDESLTAGLV